MGYSDYVIATPNMMFTDWLNKSPLTAGLGTAYTAYFKKTGFCYLTFFMGIVQNWLIYGSYVMIYYFWLNWFLLAISVVLFIIFYGWVFYHTHLLDKASAGVFHSA